MNKLTLLSPAKLNLFLSVKKKREDGFHDIVTLFERVNLYDTLKFTKTSSGKITITCSDKDVPTGPKNLVHKAAVMLQKEFCTNEGVEVDINKRIPVAAGMAGGSSNAATTLMALNKLWRLNLNITQLTSFARRIGSDVAFFLYDSSWAIGTERGDKIRPISVSSKLWHVVVTPRVRLYARDVYGILKMPLTKNKHDVNILLRNLRSNNINAISSLLKNDLEDPVLQLYPRLEVLKHRIQLLGSNGVLISGSGPSVFGITGSEAEAKKIAKKMAEHYSRVFIVATH